MAHVAVYYGTLPFTNNWTVSLLVGVKFRVLFISAVLHAHKPSEISHDVPLLRYR